MNSASEIPITPNQGFAPTPEAAPTPPPAEFATVAATDPRRKSPLLAMILSSMPGLGQIYIGYYQRGFTNAVVVAVLITVASAADLGNLLPLVTMPLAFFWLYNIIDAGRKAQLYNLALAGGTAVEPPADLKMPGLGGSVLGGTLLFVAGLVMLMHTRFDMSLEFLAEWWPVGVMAFGAYLVYKAVQDRTARDTGSTDE